MLYRFFYPILMISAGAAAAAVGVTMASAGMSLAVSVMLIVMIAYSIGIEGKLTGDICLHSIICTAGNSAEQLDACLCQRYFSAAAYAAAYEDVHMPFAEKACQSTVAAACSLNDFASRYLFVLNLIDLKGFGMTEVLKYISVFIGNSNFHYIHLP